MASCNNDNQDDLVTEALKFLGVNPRDVNDTSIVIEAMRNKIIRDPASKNSAQSMIMVLAQNTDDELAQVALITEASGTLSVGTAKAILGLEEPLHGEL